MMPFCYILQAFSGLDRALALQAKKLGNTALDAVLNAQFLVQIGIFTAVPMIIGFILEMGLLKVDYLSVYQCHVDILLPFGRM